MTTITQLNTGGGASRAAYNGQNTVVEKLYNYAFDSSYPDGGESLSTIFDEFNEVLSVEVSPIATNYVEIEDETVVITLGSFGTAADAFTLERDKIRTIPFVYNVNATAAAIQAEVRSKWSDDSLIVSGTTNAGPFTIKSQNLKHSPAVTVPVVVSCTATVTTTGSKILVYDALPGTSEIQTITLVDGPTAGTWTITYAGQTTPALAQGISAANVETAMLALSNLAGSDVTVGRTGSGTQASPHVYTFTFGGDLAGENVAALTADGSLLTNSTLTVGTTTTGTGVKERQTLTLTAGVADNTFKLTFNAQESAAITIPSGGYVNVTKAQIAAALLTITDWSAKTIVSTDDTNALYDILVGGTPGTGVFTLDFSKSLTGDIGAITVTSKTGAADGSVAETTAGVAGVSEVQTITGTDGATGGTMTWTWSGQTTSALAYNISSAAATTAVEALSNVRVGEVAVVRSGSGTQASPYIWTWTWRADSGNVAAPTASGASLTGVTATVATTQSGSETADGASLSGKSVKLLVSGYAK